MNQSERAECGNQRFLLLVDPDPLLRWSVKSHLNPSFDVVAVATLEQAETILGQRSFDAIVLSASLGDGIQGVVASARAANRGVRIVWLTTGSERLETDTTAAYIEKPFRLGALAEALRA